MAFGGRLKSSLPLFSKLLRSEPLSTPTRSFPHRALISEIPRTYSTATGHEDIDVKVPLPMFGLDGEYASALYRVSVKYNALDKVESEIRDFVESAKQAPRFTAFTKDPTVRKEVRIKAMKAICAEAKFCDYTKNFLLLVAQNGKFKLLDRIVKKFCDLTMEHRGEVKVTVTTSVPLAPDEVNELVEIVQEKLEGKFILLERKVDPKILGGIVIEYNNKLFDASIRTRALQFERYLRENVNFDDL